MTDARPRYSQKEKQAIAKTGKCYVCQDLKLPHSGFDGYELKEMHFDHYQTPFGNVGAATTSAGADVLPIHAAVRGSRPDEAGFETSTRRNCHASRGNGFTSRAAYVRAVRARMEARTVSYVDDAPANAARDASKRKFKLPVTWTADSASFLDKDYPVVSEDRNGEIWRRFLTTLPPHQLFTDDASQVREANKKVVHRMIDTFLIDGYPMFAPVNARVDKCGHVVIFDGNHRATSHTLAFGVAQPLPVMIWDIEPGGACALRSGISTTTATSQEN